MQKKYIIGAVAGLIFVVLAVMSFDQTKIEYADFQKAKQMGTTVQIMGSSDEGGEYEYDAEKNQFKFTMIDESGKKNKVIYSGGKPNNFDIAPMLVVKGEFKDDIFYANQVLTKCPSKYEGTFEELEGKSLYQ